MGNNLNAWSEALSGFYLLALQIYVYSSCFVLMLCLLLRGCLDLLQKQGQLELLQLIYQDWDIPQKQKQNFYSV